MARRFEKEDFQQVRSEDRKSAIHQSAWAAAAMGLLCASPIGDALPPQLLAALGLLPAMIFGQTAGRLAQYANVERERQEESARRRGKPVLGMPPQRDAIERMVNDAKSRGKKVVDRYLVGFELETGKPLYVDDDDIITHGCVFAKTGVGKTLWLESLMLQQMARGRASGLTFIDAKRDSGTLAHIILMALYTGRIEDLIVIDPFDPIHAYNFVMTNQRADVKARKVLRAGLPPTSDQSATKHYDRLASDSIYRVVRALESMGLAWSIRDVAVTLSTFNVAYPQLRSLLSRIGARQAMVELGHLAASYRDMKGQLDMRRITDNLRGIASELHSISAGDAGAVFCARHTDLVLTDAILRGKIIYFMLPRLEEAESAARMVKIFREDLEVSIGEITSSRVYNLEDPHLVIIDEGSSTFGPTWANLFELARKGRFALLFGAQSTGGLTDASIGLSEAFYERVMANVNLKVMMRIGDNRTAMDMTEWIGKVTTMKKSIGAGITTGKSQNFFKGHLDFSTKMTDNESQNISFSEDEEDLVSSEELKHEMAAEKGLAWFDLGDGRPVKGRTFWFNSELPDTWEGREFLPQLERFEQDEIGLADWVDEQVFVKEQQESASGVGAQPMQRPTGPMTRGPGESSGTGRASGGLRRSSGGGDAPRGGLMPGKPRGGALPSFSKPVLKAVRSARSGEAEKAPRPNGDAAGTADPQPSARSAMRRDNEGAAQGERTEGEKRGAKTVDTPSPPPSEHSPAEHLPRDKGKGNPVPRQEAERGEPKRDKAKDNAGHRSQPGRGRGDRSGGGQRSAERSTANPSTTNQSGQRDDKRRDGDQKAQPAPQQGQPPAAEAQPPQRRERFRLQPRNQPPKGGEE